MAVSGPLEDGRGTYERGDYTAALRLLGSLAERGDAEAQSKLGVMYAGGKGVSRNYREAVKWYRLAAEQGDADARFYLGGMYFEGLGVLQDYIQAHMWWNLAAANGHEKGREARDKLAELLTLANVCGLTTPYLHCPLSI